MKKIYTTMFWLSALLVLISIVLLFSYGLNLAVDFKGGSVIELSFQDERPSLDDFKSSLSKIGFSEATVNFTGDSGIILRTIELSEKEHQTVLSTLEKSFQNIREDRFESIGPVIGNELKRKSVIAIFLVLLSVIIYIAIVFRKLSRTLSPWVMGLAAMVALLHDVLVPIGVFSVLGQFYNVEISAVFVAAVLTILGYSVADSVVIFDRVRENIVRGSVVRRSEDFPEIVHASVMQTLTRSLNTTFTTLLSLFAIYFFGGDSVKYFALALMLGIFLGAYSSIFVASPLLVWWSRK